jgi:hypothetical protein
VVVSKLREWLDDNAEGAVLFDGFEDAIIGIAERCSQPLVVVYDAEKCVEILIDGGMEPEDAAEWFSVNTLGTWAGEMTPLFLWHYKEEIDDADDDE